MTESSTQRSKRRWSSLAVQATGHLLGVAAILSVNALLFVNETALEILHSGLSEALLYELLTVPVLLQVGLSACIWALIVITYKWGQLTLRERKQTTKLVLQRSKGTIMTETLIILPLFLLFTSGLAQLSINMSASVLMALGTFQASRTAWLWEPETRTAEARNGMEGNQAGVEERARIAAATVLAPVVPAEFRGTCNFSQLFDTRLRAIGRAGAFAGVAGANAVRGLTTSQEASNHENFFYATAFDGSSFAVRGAKKFYLAYCLTSASYTESGDNIVTTVTYNHSNVFPWFAYIWGERKVAAGNLGYYTEFETSATLMKQVDANPREPNSFRSTFEDIIGNLF